MIQVIHIETRDPISGGLGHIEFSITVDEQNLIHLRNLISAQEAMVKRTCTPAMNIHIAHQRTTKPFRPEDQDAGEGQSLPEESV